MTPPQQPHGPLRSFGRIKARPIKAKQAALFDSLLPSILVPEVPFDPRQMAPDAGAVWLEIGFGGGEHLAGQATKNPGALIIGAEPFQNGVASALRHIDEAGASNVRIHPGDGREVIDRLPDGSIDRLFVLFPDPWQKARHNKRRLVNAEFLAEAHRILKPGGRFRFATDWADYADWTAERVLASGLFTWEAERADDWRRAPDDHLTTRYEEKKLGDIPPVWLDFVRN
jgi:tRNA (guanine-N7-)-methyltransferase